MTKIAIKDSPNLPKGGLAEIYQDMGVTMALLTRQGPTEFTRITPFVKCRDFIVDVFTYDKAEKKFGIYGMAYDPSKDRVQWDGVYLQLIFPSPAAQQNFEAHLSQTLHPIELANQMTPTEYTPLETKQQAVVIADKKWLLSCLSWSLYTAIVRCMCYGMPDGSKWIEVMSTTYKDKTDGRLVASVDGSVWKAVLENLETLALPEFCGFKPSGSNIGTIHHNSGFFSVFGTHRELSRDSVMKNTHWKHFKDAGWTLNTK